MMTEVERALMPVVDKLVEAIFFGARGSDEVSQALYDALIIFMEIPVEAGVTQMYKQWLIENKAL
jgi:hypothetical protein